MTDYLRKIKWTGYSSVGSKDVKFIESQPFTDQAQAEQAANDLEKLFKQKHGEILSSSENEGYDGYDTDAAKSLAAPYKNVAIEPVDYGQTHSVRIYNTNEHALLDAIGASNEKITRLEAVALYTQWEKKMVDGKPRIVSGIMREQEANLFAHALTAEAAQLHEIIPRNHVHVNVTPCADQIGYAHVEISGINQDRFEQVFHASFRADYTTKAKNSSPEISSDYPGKISRL